MINKVGNVIYMCRIKNYKESMSLCRTSNWVCLHSILSGQIKLFFLKKKNITELQSFILYLNILEK